MMKIFIFLNKLIVSCIILFIISGNLANLYGNEPIPNVEQTEYINNNENIQELSIGQINLIMPLTLENTAIVTSESALQIALDDNTITNIVLATDIELTTELIISKPNRVITFLSDDSSVKRVITCAYNKRHLLVTGSDTSLKFENVVLEGNDLAGIVPWPRDIIDGGIKATGKNLEMDGLSISKCLSVPPSGISNISEGIISYRELNPSSVSDFTLKNSSVSNNPGYSVGIEANWANVRIENTDVTDNAMEGVYTTSSNLFIQNCNIYHNNYGVYISGNMGVDYLAKIDNSSINRNTAGGISCIVGDLTITDSIINNSGLFSDTTYSTFANGVYFAGKNLYISNSEICNSSETGVFIYVPAGAQNTLYKITSGKINGNGQVVKNPGTSINGSGVRLYTADNSSHKFNLVLGEENGATLEIQDNQAATGGTYMYKLISIEQWQSGGGVNVPNLSCLSVHNNVVFKDNKANNYSFWQLSDDYLSNLHRTHVFTDRFSSFKDIGNQEVLFTNGYNGYDINYIDNNVGVTFDANGGNFDSGDTKNYMAIPRGSKIPNEQVLIPNRPFFNFVGWFENINSNPRQWDFAEDIVTQDVILTAMWNSIVPTVTPTASPTENPTASPTESATNSPTANPSESVSVTPTATATITPTETIGTGDLEQTENPVSTEVPNANTTAPPKETAPPVVIEIPTPIFSPTATPITVLDNENNEVDNKQTTQQITQVPNDKIPQGMVATELPNVYQMLDEEGTPLGYYTPFVKENGIVEWVEVNKDGIPLGSLHIDKTNPKTGVAENSILYVISIFGILILHKKYTAAI